MQTQHLLIIGICVAIYLLVKAYVIRKAIRRSFEQGVTSQADYHLNQVAALNADIAHLARARQESNERHQREIRALKADYLATYNLSQHAAVPTFTETDHQFLMQVHGTLLLAKQTWRALPGTDPIQLKAERQAETVLELASRIKDTLEPAPVYEMPQSVILPGAAA
jgi:hypothetical protein